MTPIADLLVASLAAAVLVFVVSSLLHMLLTYHRTDQDPLPDEDRILEAMRAAGVRPGAYRFPYASCMDDLKDGKVREKFERGPVGYLTVLPNGLPNMGRALGLWFAYAFVVALLVAYVVGLHLGPGASFREAFRATSGAAFLAHGIAVLPDTIWKGQSWAVTGKFLFDGLLYALATGAAFGWLWPEAL